MSLTGNITGYELSKSWFDFCFENPEKITPNHTALYFFILDLCNRLGWRDKFGLPTDATQYATGIRNYKTYAKSFNDLVEWGFVEVITKSRNQYSATIIALVKKTKASPKQVQGTDQSMSEAPTKASPKQVQSIVDINKLNKPLKTIKTIKTNSVFTPPSLEQVKEYFMANGYTETSAIKAFNYYDAGNWKDGQGHQVKNWKQKMQGVWFKDENKATATDPRKTKFVA